MAQPKVETLARKKAKDAHLKEKHVESRFNIFDFIAVVCAC